MNCGTMTTPEDLCKAAYGRGVEDGKKPAVKLPPIKEKK
jgi:hypothetical protein